MKPKRKRTRDDAMHALASSIRGRWHPQDRGTLNSVYDECVTEACDLMRRLRRKGFGIVRIRA